MSLKHLQSLLARGASIHAVIKTERRRLRPDWIKLLQLKKLRLMISDRLYQIGIMPPATACLATASILRRR